MIGLPIRIDTRESAVSRAHCIALPLGALEAQTELEGSFAQLAE